MSAGKFILAALFALHAGAASADGVVDKLMTQADKARLKQYEATRKTALQEAKAGGNGKDVATLESLLAKPNLDFSGFDLTGAWQCRTIKAGGPAPLVVYDGAKRLIYLGSFFVAGDPVMPYGKGPQTDQVGYAFRSGRTEWRLELPAPYYESKLDIIELKR